MAEVKSKAKKAATTTPEFRTEGRTLSKQRQRMVDNNGNLNLRPAPLDDTNSPTKVIKGGLRVPDPDAITERDVSKAPVGAKAEKSQQTLGEVGTAAQVANSGDGAKGQNDKKEKPEDKTGAPVV